MYKLRPSAAKIWLNCPIAPKMTAMVPYSETKFTRKGTNLHGLASNILKDKYGYTGDREQVSYVNQLELDDVRQYLRFIDSLTTDVFQDDTFDILIEEKIPLGDFLYDGNGIVDYCAYNMDNLLLIDYKTGFKRVYPDNNPQLNIYALGMLYKIEKELNYRPENIFVAISQPSQNNNRYVKTTRGDLFKWLLSHKEDIDRAYTATGDFNVGPHCQFCPARGSCIAHLRKALAENIIYEEEETDA